MQEKLEKSEEMEEMVAVNLFCDHVQYKEDVFVAVNGKNYRIPRGKSVQVPKAVAEVLETATRQDAYAKRLMQQAKRGNGGGV